MARKKKRRANGTGSVLYLGKERRKPYAIRLTAGWSATGKQLFRYGGQCYATQKEAQMALAAELLHPRPPRAEITLEALFNEWKADYYQRISRSTQDNYNSAWLVLSALKMKPFREIRKSQVQELIEGCGKSRSSMEKIRALYSLLCQHAMADDLIDKNYAALVKLPRAIKVEKEVFSDEERDVLWEKVDTVPGVDYILIMLYTGLRISEFLELKMENVFLDQQYLIGGKKTEAGTNRVIPIHHKIMPLIQRHYDQNSALLIRRPESGDKYPTKYFREKVYYTALEQAGLPPRVPHCTRHTFATGLVRAGVAPSEIQRLLGHKKVSVHCGHLCA